jgi:hypothetical protein
MRKIATILATLGAIVASLLVIDSAMASTLQGYQGGTGFGPTVATTSAGQYLQVASTSPFLTWQLATPTSSGGSGTVGPSTSTYIAVFNASGTIIGYANLNFVSSTGILSAPTGTFSGSLAIGTTTPQRILHVYGDQSQGVGLFERTNAATSSPIGTVIIQGDSTGNAKAGWGPSFIFRMQDASGTNTQSGAIQNVASGPGTSSTQMLFYASNASASPVLGLTLDQNGNALLNGITTTAITDNTLGLGVVHSSSGGVFTSSNVVNTDIANSTIDLTAKVTGVLPTANGGTNKSSWTAGSVVFASSTTQLGEDNANFFWDNTNHRMGLGTTGPNAPLEITNSASISGQQIPEYITSSGTTRLQINSSAASPNDGFGLLNNGALAWSVAAYKPTGTNLSLTMFNDALNSPGIFINGDTNDIAMGGGTTPATTLDVAGTIRSTAQVVPSSGAGLELNYDSVHNRAGILSYDRTGNNYKDLYIQDEVYVIGTSTRNVGIGNSTPSSTLTVNGSFAMGLLEVSTSTTLTATSSIVGITSTSTVDTITLPSATVIATGMILTIKDEGGNAGTNNIKVVTQSSQKIDGATSTVIASNYGSISLYSNGTQFYVQ